MVVLSLVLSLGIFAGVNAMMFEGTPEEMKEMLKCKSEEILGGLFHTNLEDFSQGISVGGTTVIDSDGNYDGAITSSNGTFSGTLAVTGETTMKEGATDITATTTLTAAQSGSTFYIDPADGIQATITLPAAAAGLFFNFVVDGNFTVDVSVISAETANIEGSLNVAGAVVDCRDEDAVNFIADGEEEGDFFVLRSNGTKWFIGASASLTSGKVTCTT